MNVFTDATNVGVIKDGLHEHASSLMFDLPSFKRLNRLKSVAFFISLVCWALCIVLYVSVAEYPKLKQNLTAAHNSSFSGSTIMDAVCERCASLKCTLNALHMHGMTSESTWKKLIDVRSIADNISRNFAKKQGSKSCQVILTLL